MRLICPYCPRPLVTERHVDACLTRFRQLHEAKMRTMLSPLIERAAIKSRASEALRLANDNQDK